MGTSFSINTAGGALIGMLAIILVLAFTHFISVRVGD